jgi:3-methyladenine DNA glycosylase AlkD
MTVDNLNYFLKQMEEKYCIQGWPSGTDRKIKIKEITEEIKIYLKGLGEDKSSANIAKIWSYFFMNTQNENWLQVLAIFYFKNIASKRNGEIIHYWPLLKKWITRLKGWGFADMTSSIYSQLVEDAPTVIYPVLIEWAENNNPWYKRVAIVSSIYYYRCRKRFLPFDKIIDLLEPQIEIDHYYLQKGVGWTLKELTQAYSEETFEFMLKNANKIKSTAFSAAIEKIPKAQKEEIKALRKQLRSNRKER